MRPRTTKTLPLTPPATQALTNRWTLHRPDALQGRVNAFSRKANDNAFT